MIFIPCNTSHYFYEELKNSTSVPILNMIEDTIKYVRDKGIKKVLILATEGTTKSRLYQNMCEKYKVEYIESDEVLQNKITNIIYNNIKSGKMINIDEWNEVIKPYKVDAYILGCTELSILKGKLGLGNEFIDPLEIEAENVIKFFGKEIKK